MAELEGRAAALAERRPGGEPRAALELLVTCLDLTSLEPTDTPERIAELCARARRPDPADPTVPPVAAVCVLPPLVPVAVEALSGSPVRVAAAAGGFPTAQGPLEARLAEIRGAVEDGADEVDVVLNRSPLLAGDPGAAFEELVASREAAGRARLKVILETGALETCAAIREAAMLAMAAGADFVKTSTGKVAPGASPPAALCMMQAAADFHAATGRAVGVKVSGGIRAADQALAYLALVEDALGPAWRTPERFRIGASALLDDLVRRIAEARTPPKPG